MPSQEGKAYQIETLIPVRALKGTGSTNQSVTVVTSLVLEATPRLFDALGASAASQAFGLDRHRRNARTITSQNPRIYRDRVVGDFAVNGTPPPPQYRVGLN